MKEHPKALNKRPGEIAAALKQLNRINYGCLGAIQGAIYSSRSTARQGAPSAPRMRMGKQINS
jgi:hypothetical protein